MPTNYPRRTCICCGVKSVAWKSPTATNPTGTKKIYFCWECAEKFYYELRDVNITHPPVKKFLIYRAWDLFRQRQKRENETFRF